MTEAFLRRFHQGKDPNWLFRAGLRLIGLCACFIVFAPRHEVALLLISSATIPLLLSWLMIGPVFRKTERGLILTAFPFRPSLIEWGSISKVEIRRSWLILHVRGDELRLAVLTAGASEPFAEAIETLARRQ